MAIAPIQIPNQTANPLQAIMQGTATITDYFDKAIQLGRDQANNQARQDQALVQNMQLAQGLSQRRAQDLDARLTDRRNFDYREEQDKIQLGLRKEALQDNRDARLFNQEMAQQKFGFAQDQALVGNDLRTRQLDATIANQEADNAYRRDALDATIADRNAGNSIDQERLKLEQQRAAREEQIFNAGGGTKPLTRADIRAERGLEIREEDRAAKTNEDRMRQMVTGDTSAFVPQQTFLAKDATDQERALAQAYDKNAFESELESARNMTLADYVKKVPSASKKRTDFWKYANQQAAEQSSGVSDQIRKLLGR